MKKVRKGVAVADDLLNKIFEHQLLLSKEIQKRLEKYLNEDLRKAFAANESYLNTLLEKSKVLPEELDKLQRLWDDLTGRINKLRQETTGTLDVINSQEQIAKLYNT